MKYSPSDMCQTQKKKGKSLGLYWVTVCKVSCLLYLSVAWSLIFIIILLSALVGMYLGSCCHQIHRRRSRSGKGVVAGRRVGSCCRHGGKSSGKEGAAGSIELLWRWPWSSWWLGAWLKSCSCEVSLHHGVLGEWWSSGTLGCTGWFLCLHWLLPLAVSGSSVLEPHLDLGLIDAC